RLPNRRMRVRVGDHDEWPDGPWLRTRVWVDDLDRDVTIKVRDVRPSDHQTTLLKVEATAKVHVERERQQWRRGLLLLGLLARADNPPPRENWAPCPPGAAPSPCWRRACSLSPAPPAPPTTPPRSSSPGSSTPPSSPRCPASTRTNPAGARRCRSRRASSWPTC